MLKAQGVRCLFYACETSFLLEINVFQSFMYCSFISSSISHCISPSASVGINQENIPLAEIEN